MCRAFAFRPSGFFVVDLWRHEYANSITIMIRFPAEARPFLRPVIVCAITHLFASVRCSRHSGRPHRVLLPTQTAATCYSDIVHGEAARPVRILVFPYNRETVGTAAQRACFRQVPIYAVESWLALRFKGESIYLEALRDWYVVSARLRVCASSSLRVVSVLSHVRPLRFNNVKIVMKVSYSWLAVLACPVCDRGENLEQCSIFCVCCRGDLAVAGCL